MGTSVAVYGRWRYGYLEARLCHREEGAAMEAAPVTWNRTRESNGRGGET
jgi:hypothetical protein